MHKIIKNPKHLKLTVSIFLVVSVAINTVLENIVGNMSD